MNKVILILSLLAISAMAMPVNIGELKSLWDSWKGYYGKDYVLAEEVARFAIFVENYKKIVEFNSKNENVKQAINQFADITAEEFKNLYSLDFLPTDDIASAESPAYGYSEIDLPTSVDWRSKGAVTPAKNQGQCGSCWAFSATGALEGLYAIDTGKLESFSEQALVDCVTKNQGCNGGSISAAFAYTASHGVPTEADYPYTGQAGSCKSTSSVRVNSGFQWVSFRDALALKTQLVQQPVSVAIEADQNIFQFYSSGVISSGCGYNLDHAVLAVGYDANSFIVKNSWGSSWGQNGFVQISSDATANSGNGVCGILAQPVVPVK